MRQAGAFLNGEGDKYLERNREKMFANAETDPVLRVLVEQEIAPKTVLEVGCSNGWRLAQIHATYGSDCVGIEPSAAACDEAAHRFPTIKVIQTTAEKMPFVTANFDLIIFGFCLYLVDREDLFKIVYDTDRLLVPGGHLVIFDFYTGTPHIVRYHHADGLFSYKMAYDRLWTGNPMYYVQSHYPDDEGTAVTVVKKRLSWTNP